MAVSLINLPHDNYLVQGFYKLLRLVSVANTLLVTLTIGVLLKFKDLTRVLPIVLLACIIKLVIQPLLSHYQAEWLGFPDIWHQIVVIESAMPTAALTAVFSKKYGCDTELTTILIFATFISSIFTIIMMVFLLG
jgi:predicted permease